MKLSVIIPCFNAARTIEDVFRTLLEQSWPDEWEVIVADNGSTDNLPQVAERYKRRFPRLSVVDASARRGASHARTYYYLNEIPFADHGALLDPPTADVSARCAMLVMAKVIKKYKDEGLDAGDRAKHEKVVEYLPTLERTIEYLRSEQEADGSWFGRWGTNYIYGTWSVLLGLEQTGIPKDDPMYTKAVKWLMDIQREDAGWGEDNFRSRHKLQRQIPI